MSYKAEILADSISPDKNRLTTFCIRFPRFLLAELNTHRTFSRSSASSRAIPTEKLIDQILTEPYVPVFRKRVTGMGVGELLSLGEQEDAQSIWLEARDSAASQAHGLLHVDKSRANRLLEPFLWHTAIVASTTFSNFFALRSPPGDVPDPDFPAQIEFQEIALLMRKLYETSVPKKLDYGQWHLPLVKIRGKIADLNDVYRAYASAGRCARISFDKAHLEEDLQKSIERTEMLINSGHMSPLEFPAMVAWANCPYGNYTGFKPLRKFIKNEHDFSLLDCS